MQFRQKQAIEAYTRVRDFVDAHPLEPPASYGIAHPMLDAVIAQLAAHAIDQVTFRRQARAQTQRQRVLQRRLRERHLRPIAKIGAALPRAFPDLRLVMRLPDRAMPVTRLVAEAAGVRRTITPHAPLFRERGCPEDFLDQLDAAIAALEGSLFDRARLIGTGIAARVGIEEEIRRGRDAVEMLDAVVMRAFAEHPPVLGDWRAIRRLHRIPGRDRSTAPGPRPPVQPEEVPPPRKAA